MRADRDRMAEIADPLSTKAAKIRALARAGFARADIARFLEIRYQHVRNVLTQVRPASETARPAPAGPIGARGFAERSSASLSEVAPADAEIASDGTLRLPMGILEQAEIQPGDRVLVRVVDGEVRLSSYAASVRRARALFRKYVPDGTAVVDRFVAERARMWGEE